MNQVIWLRNILTDLDLEQDKSTEVFVDNQAAISISHNHVFHGKTKHFNVKLFRLREVQEHGDASLIYCLIEDQTTYMFTKLFPLSRFKFLRKKARSLQPPRQGGVSRRCLFWGVLGSFQSSFSLNKSNCFYLESVTSCVLFFIEVISSGC